MTLVHVSDAAYDLADSMEISPMEAVGLIEGFLDDDNDEILGIDNDE